MAVTMNVHIRVVKMRKTTDQKIRPERDEARLIRRIPCEGELKIQCLIMLNALFSLSDCSLNVVILIEVNEFAVISVSRQLFLSGKREKEREVKISRCF